MKCIDCKHCRKGWFKSKPAAYVCIGVKEPFVINNPSVECTEYPEKNKKNNFGGLNMWNIVAHIAANIRYFECAYNKSPERIFISTPLIRELESENTVVCRHRDGDYMTCCGILVEEFYSDKLEYYLAESGFNIEI